MDDDALRQYLDHIGRYPLLSRDEEIELAKTIEAGRNSNSPTLHRKAQQAREKFINANLRLVVSVAKHYQKTGIPLLDLIQEGNIGLEYAVDRFDWRQGCKFSTYAIWWIRQAIQRSLRKSRLIYIPEHIKQRQVALWRFRDGTPLEEISKLTKIPIQELEQAQSFYYQYCSLDKALPGEGEHPLSNIIADKDAFEEVENALFEEAVKSQILQRLSALSEKDQKLFRMYTGIGCRKHKAAEIAKEFGWHKNSVTGRFRALRKKLIDMSLDDLVQAS